MSEVGELGVLVMAYGTPRHPEEIPAYYTHIRRGRPPSPEELADLTARYEAIGGVSPLAERTEAQRAAIEAALSALLGRPVPVVLGQKHAAPFIEDGAAELAGVGIERIVGLVLAPHYSRTSVGAYHERAGQAAQRSGVEYLPVDSWHLLPALIEFLAAALAEARRTLPERHKVLFSAHSLPERVLAGDPYPVQLHETASAVAARIDLLPWADWALCWQSAGRTPEPWRGPDLRDVIRELAATGRSEGVLVCPQGFTADHLEVLYDLDIEARLVAEDAGLAFARTRSINADPAVMEALAELVLRRAEQPGPGRPGAR
jgi:ferrochelatase